MLVGVQKEARLLRRESERSGGDHQQAEENEGLARKFADKTEKRVFERLLDHQD